MVEKWFSALVAPNSIRKRLGLKKKKKRAKQPHFKQLNSLKNWSRNEIVPGVKPREPI